MNRKFLRWVIDLLTALVSKALRYNKVYPDKDERDGFVKVNLGCGLRVVKGWLNIDGSFNALFASWPTVFHKLLYSISGAREYYSLEKFCYILKNHRFLYHDLTLSLPLHSNTVDFIYSSHFIEHIFKDDAVCLLNACAKALRRGGTIRISIPDLSYAVSLYGQGRKTEMLENYFFVMGKGSYLARHKYMYDFELIKEVLEQAGFSEVKRCTYQQGQTPDIKLLDVYPESSLFVEAIRP